MSDVVKSAKKTGGNNPKPKKAIDKVASSKKALGDKTNTAKDSLDDRAASMGVGKRAPVNASKAKDAKSAPTDVKRVTSTAKDAARKVKSNASKGPVDPEDAATSAAESAKSQTNPKKSKSATRSAQSLATPSVDPKGAAESGRNPQSVTPTLMDPESAALPAKAADAVNKESFAKDADLPTPKPDVASQYDLKKATAVLNAALNDEEKARLTPGRRAVEDAKAKVEDRAEVASDAADATSDGDEVSENEEEDGDPTEDDEVEEASDIKGEDEETSEDKKISSEEASKDDEVTEDAQSDEEDVEEASEASDAEEGAQVKAASDEGEEEAGSGEEGVASEAEEDASEAPEEESEAAEIEEANDEEEEEEAEEASESEAEAVSGAEAKQISDAEEGSAEEEASDAEAEDAEDAEEADSGEENGLEAGGNAETSEDDVASGDEEAATAGAAENATSTAPGDDTSSDETQPTTPDEVDVSRLKNGTVNKGGNVVVDGKVVGRIKEGVLSKLIGKRVDENGAIWNDSGKKIGAAELIPDDELESMLKDPAPFEVFPDATVGREGYVVSEGERVGKVAEGNPKKLRGMHVDADGDILDRAGNVIGHAERWEEEEPEPELEPETPDLSSLAGKRVNKAGNIVDSSGSIWGRVVEGEPRRMVGRMCDKNGNILSESGDVIGKAELVSEGGRAGEKTGPFTGLVGCKVNKNGKVLSATGETVGKLVQGDAKQLAGREVDDDGDICDKNGNVIGHAEREYVEEEDPKVVEEREQAVKDKKLAQQLAYCIQQTLDQLKPICEKISRKIEAAENTPKDELDEEKLVAQVRPLIEDGGRLLSETNGIIRGLDPDGRIQQQVKQKAATHDATPEEYHLADLLKELTCTVAKTIDDAKRKLEGMPRAKKKLNPLWHLLSEPLGQIIAGVGLLLSGVLGIVGNLLNGLGLGGLVNGLLGSLGIDKVLDGLGLGNVTEAVSGKSKEGKGLLGGIL